MAIFLRKDLNRLYSSALADVIADGYTVEVGVIPMSSRFGSVSGMFMLRDRKRYLLTWVAYTEYGERNGKRAYTNRKVLILISENAANVSEAIKTYVSAYEIAYDVFTDNLDEYNEARHKRSERRRMQRYDRMGTRIDLDCIQSRYIALAYLHRQRGYMRCKLDAVAHVYKWIDVDRGTGHFCISTTKGDVFDLR